MTKNVSNGKVNPVWANQELFSTGDVAKICQISQQSIIRSFDSGRLRGFKIPGSKFRKIPRADLVTFMRENKIPTDVLGVATEKDSRTKVLWCGTDVDLFARLVDDDDYKEKCRTSDACANLLDAGLHYQALRHRIVIFGPGIDGDHVMAANIIMHRFGGVEKLRVIVLCNKASEAGVRKNLEYSEIKTFSGTPDEFVPFVLQYVPNG